MGELHKDVQEHPPFSVSRTILFFRHLDPSKNPTPKNKKKLQTPQKHLKIGRGGAITGNIVLNILHNKGGV